MRSTRPFAVVAAAFMLTLGLAACSASGDHAASTDSDSGPTGALPSGQPVETDEDVNVGGLDVVASEPGRSNPASIGPFRLLTQEVIDELGFGCVGEPLAEYDDYALWPHGGGVELAQVSYVHPGELDLERSAGQNCAALSIVNMDGETWPGVVVATIDRLGNPPQEEMREPRCTSNGYIAGCWLRYPSGVRVQVKTELNDGPHGNTDFLQEFFDAYVANNELVQAYITAPAPQQ